MDEYIRFNGSRVKNIKGQHFGHLIPQKIVGIKNKYAVWECLCELCGGTREVSAKRLNSCSNTTMCEKCTKEKRKEQLSRSRGENTIASQDLTGKQFGFWKVLKKGERINNIQMWECECKCGTVKQVTAYNLISGRSTNCGCVASYNLIGKRRGMLKVIGIAKEGGLHCICQCDCGNVIKCTAAEFGWRRSCGCAGEIEKEKHTKISIALYGKKIRSDNTSGVIGVRRANGKWGAAITFQKKVYWLGTFDSIKDAANARKEAENHLYGDFLEWYAETYPNAKKNIKGREKKSSGKD